MTHGLFGKAINTYKKEGVSNTILKSGHYVASKTGIEDQYMRTRHRINRGRITQKIGTVEVDLRAESFTEFKRCAMLMHERDIIRDVVREAEPDDVFFDIGANIGIYSSFVGQYLDTGVVIGFEPEPANIESYRLNQNLNDNPHTAKQIALSDQNGIAQLEIRGDETGEGRHQLATQEADNTIEVETSRGDDLVEKNEVPPPNVVKIDVEGAELNVIKGLSNQLSKPNCRVVFCEIHPDRLASFGGSYEEVVDVLERAGFNIDTIRGSDGEYSHIKGTKS